TYANGIFVTIANGSSLAATSPDGLTWTQRTMPSSSQWNSVIYGNGLFVAIAGGPSTTAATSPDGITWTARTLPSSQQWNSVAYGNGTFVTLVGGDTKAAWSSASIAPPPPTNLKVVPGTNQLTASWDTISDATNYDVKVMDGSTTVGTYNTASTNYNATG